MFNTSRPTDVHSIQVNSEFSEKRIRKLDVGPKLVGCKCSIARLNCATNTLHHQSYFKKQTEHLDIWNACL